jgi:hypothetical protein
MKTFWLGLAAMCASVGATAAQATVFSFDIQFWDGNGNPPANPDPGDFAHFVVDDAFGGTIGVHGSPGGIWTYGSDGSYFGTSYQNAFIDIYNADAGGGFDFVPYVVDGDSNDPDYNWEIGFQGASVLGGTVGDYHIQTGVYDYDYYGEGTIRVTIASADAAPAPEPASWVMMLGGFGLIGGALRHQRRARVHFA